MNAVSAATTRAKSKFLVSLAHLKVEFGELVQHQPLEIGHRRGADRIALVTMGQSPQHPTNCVAQLAIIVANSFQDFRANALIVGIVDARHPQAQDVSA